jgi:hypothetical protein
MGHCLVTEKVLVPEEDPRLTSDGPRLEFASMSAAIVAAAGWLRVVERSVEELQAATARRRAVLQVREVFLSMW